MRALNSLAAKMSEKWEMLHFPLLREKTGFMRPRRGDTATAPAEAGAEGGTCRSNEKLPGSHVSGRPVQVRFAASRRLHSEDVVPAPLVGSGVCLLQRHKPNRGGGSPSRTIIHPTQQMSRSSEYITTSCFQHAGVWLYQNIRRAERPHRGTHYRASPARLRLKAAKEGCLQ